LCVAGNPAIDVSVGCGSRQSGGKILTLVHF
jgi:hypothetical protein